MNKLTHSIKPEVCHFRLSFYSKGLFIFMLSLILDFQLTAQSKWHADLLNYINLKLEKTDGGYGWEDQPDSHLTPTFAVIGILHDIDELPANHDKLISFVRSHHPQYASNSASALTYKETHEVLYLKGEFLSGEAGASGSEMMDLIYQQIQGILWLGGDVEEFRDPLRLWKSQAGNAANYEEHGYPVLLQEMMTTICRHLLKVSAEDSLSVIAYLGSRRRVNGSFNNAPVTDGGDGNILNTYWSLYALNTFNKIDLLKEETTKWLQSCQLKSGGFTHQPSPSIGTNTDVAYTWAGIKALRLLSSEPINREECIAYILSLRNADGGFGNQPGLPSTPMSTYYAIDALKSLGALTSLDAEVILKKSPITQKHDLSGLNIYTVQFEAQGSGSPEEAVELADKLQINMWGAKNGDQKWISTAQRIADKRKVPVTFFIADEPYGKSVSVSGMGTFGHILDFICPPDIRLPETGNSQSWQEYQKNYIQPLINDHGALILQISNNEPLFRILLDESIKNKAYAAISTIHFDQNFLFWVPSLYQYRYQLPFIALQDAHGTESWWWSDELLHYRTLFLAKKPTYDEMMNALNHNWIVAVRHDSLSGYKTRMLGGASGVQEYIKARQKEWKWWGDDPINLLRPWAVITILNKKDSLETARPDNGLNVRIRCWWISNRPVLKKPVVTLTQLKIDNKVVKTDYFEIKDRSGRSVTDTYFLYSMPDPKKGVHTVEATLKFLKDNSLRVIKKKFIY